MDLDNITIGDDEVLVLTTQPETEPEVKNEFQSSGSKSRFFTRLWSWFHQRYKLRRIPKTPRKTRRKSTEFHSKRVLTTNLNEITESERVKGQVILNKWQRVKSSETLAKSSWADVCTSLDRRRPPHPVRRSSYMPTQTTARPERHRTCSLVAGNQSLLHPHAVSTCTTLHYVI